MAIEAGLWVALSVLAPLAIAQVWPRLAARLGPWAEPVRRIGPWLHSLAPAYVALLSGAVLGYDSGLYGQTWAEWIGGAAGCGGVLAVGFWLKRRTQLAARADLPGPAEGFRDEVRWALYRAAGALWTGSVPAGVTVGLGLAILEWTLGRRIWTGRAWRAPAMWVPVFRAGLSGALFLATRNFWLTMLTQVGLLFVLPPQLQNAGTPDPAPQSNAPNEDA